MNCAPPQQWNMYTCEGGIFTDSMCHYATPSRINNDSQQRLRYKTLFYQVFTQHNHMSPPVQIEDEYCHSPDRSDPRSTKRRSTRLSQLGLLFSSLITNVNTFSKPQRIHPSPTVCKASKELLEKLGKVLIEMILASGLTKMSKDELKQWLKKIHTTILRCATSSTNIAI